MRQMTMSDMRAVAGHLVREAAQGHRTAITDHGVPTAVIIGAEELADLEEELALARIDLARARGELAAPVSHDEVKAKLGLS